MLNFFYRSVAKSEMNLLAIKNRIDIYLKKGNERNVLAKYGAQNEAYKTIY